MDQLHRIVSCLHKNNFKRVFETLSQQTNGAQRTQIENGRRYNKTMQKHIVCQLHDSSKNIKYRLLKVVRTSVKNV